MSAERLTVGRIAHEIGADVIGDPDFTIVGVCSLLKPRQGCLAFSKQAHQVPLVSSGPIFAVVAPSDTGPSDLPLLLVDNPRLGFARAMQAFFTAAPSGVVASSARIASSAHLGRNVTVGEGSVICEDAEIGDDTEIRHNVVIGRGVKIGSRCLIKSNTVIGEEGFGFEPGSDGNYVRLPHIGSVVIADDVEIGALNTVASGTVSPTRVGQGTKTDDHVHIAHNCDVGCNVIITAGAELSGSVTVGDNAWLGPNCSIMNGIDIAAGTMVGLGAIVAKSTVQDGVYPGARSTLMRLRKR